MHIIKGMIPETMPGFNPGQMQKIIRENDFFL